MSTSWIGTTVPELVTISVARAGQSACITVSGEVDCSSAPDLRACIDSELTGDVAELVVDLAGVTFLDSAGLSVLAGAHRRAGDAGTRLRVLAGSRAVVRPLEITGLWHLLGAERVQPADDAATA
ncbi:STAS domain-containing protein [Blastococcus sp. SYSU D00820]